MGPDKVKTKGLKTKITKIGRKDLVTELTSEARDPISKKQPGFKPENQIQVNEPIRVKSSAECQAV